MTAHLVPVDGPEIELVFDASAPFGPPPGNYFAWLQGEWLMSPFARYGSFGSGVHLFPVVPAGKVILPAPIPAEDGMQLHLLHAGSYREDGYLRWELWVRRPVSSIGDGVLMPEGRAVAALWRSTTDSYVAISRPFEVRAGASTRVPLLVPTGMTHLLARVAWGEPGRQGNPFVEGMRLTVAVAGKSVEPSLLITTAFRTYALWYGLEGQPGELRGESTHTYVREPLQLTPGTVEVVKTVVGTKASLNVELRLPTSLSKEDLAVELRRRPADEIVERRIPGDAHQLLFDSLIPGDFEAILETRLGRFVRSVQLGDGENGSLLLEPDVLTLHGMVSQRDRGHSATLSFTSTGRNTREVSANEAGAYEATLLAPVRMVSIDLDDGRSAPFVEYFFPAIEESGQRDFEIPATTIRARVRDQVTGKGVSGAEVSVRSVYRSTDAGQATQSAPERVVQQRVVADKDGWAVLPPQRPGSAEIHAAATGYYPTKVPQRVDILSSEAEHEIDLPLEPVGETVTARFGLPGGLAADAAAIHVVQSASSESRVVFAGRTDSDGTIKIPRRWEGLLLANHPRSGLFVGDWHPGEEQSVDFELPVAAGRAFRIRVRNSRGDAVPGTELALGVDGHRLAGEALAVATGSVPRTDRGGYWTTARLAARQVEVLVWALSTRDAAKRGLLDSQIVSAAFPWPEVVEVRLAE